MSTDANVVLGTEGSPSVGYDKHSHHEGKSIYPKDSGDDGICLSCLMFLSHETFAGWRHGQAGPASVQSGIQALQWWLCQSGTARIPFWREKENSEHVRTLS